MNFQVSATDLAHLRFNETDPVVSALQNIAVILSTPKGSVPMYREFGIPQDYLDKPTPIAKTMMIAPVREAVEKWEPRARVLNVQFEEDVSRPGKLVPTVEVEIRSEQKQ